MLSNRPRCMDIDRLKERSNFKVKDSELVVGQSWGINGPRVER